MTYSDFSLAAVQKMLGLEVRRVALFAGVASIEPPPWLREGLDKGLQLTLGSEKARSEFIVVPVLLTSRELSRNRIAIYSGQRLDVAPEKGLFGECDFILARSQPLPVLQAPFVTIVEAKKNEIDSGLGQCAAQMAGARLFNQREGSPVGSVFGCVTTGEDWQFLKLDDETLSLDDRRYYINHVGEILGVFQAMINSGQSA